jgi:N-acetylneuraminic acid mutarotase
MLRLSVDVPCIFITPFKKIPSFMHPQSNSFSFVTILATVLCLTISSCNKCKDEPVITYFAFEELSPKKVGILDQSGYSITVEVPDSIDVTNLSPTVNLGSSDCLNLSPLSGTSQDFSTPVMYEVSNENGDLTRYEVTVSLKEPEPKDSILQISWSTGSDIPVAAAWSASAFLNNKLYVSGGAVEAGVSNLVQVYDPEMESWTTAESRLQQGRWGHTSIVLDGKIYEMGGLDTAKGPALTSIEVYDPDTDTWENKGEMEIGRIGHGAVAYEGKIYVMGGELQEPSPGALDRVEVYDPATLTWETLAPMPTPRIFMAICLVGDVIYVLGGGKSYPFKGITSIEAYNIAEDSWEEKAELKIGLIDLDACVINGKIICVGGTELWTIDAQASVQVYDPGANRVFRANDMQSARGATSVFSYQDKIFVSGGYKTIKPEFTFSSYTEIGVPEF